MIFSAVLLARSDAFTQQMPSLAHSDVAWTVALAVTAVACCYYIAPAASGSGIPEMKSMLSGFDMPGYLSWRTLLAKVVGLTLALGSSLPVGKEGPFVHIACIVAFQLLQLPCFSAVYDCETLTQHTLAAASAVGVSSTFGTPVGGVLFAVEVMSSYMTVSSCRFCIK